MGLVILGSWQRRERKYSGGEGALTRVVEGGGHFCFFFRNEHTLRRAIQYSKNLQVKSEPITLYYRVDILCPREESGVFLIHTGNLSHVRCFFCFWFFGTRTTW
jgi:hypothetical protein